MKTLAIGDIHGSYLGLKQCLERSNFDYKKDQLIVLGDVADGYPEPLDAFMEIAKIKNYIFIMGNHDWWLWNYMKTGASPYEWMAQGGQATLDNYIKHDEEYRATALDILNKSKFYYVDEDNRLFTHGGFVGRKSIEAEHSQTLMWDRSAYELAKGLQKKLDNPKNTTKIREVEPHKGAIKRLETFSEIFIGHTGYTPPFKQNYNVFNLDTGAGWNGYLTIMDVKTKEHWHSDLSYDLYPESDQAATLDRLRINRI